MNSEYPTKKPEISEPKEAAAEIPGMVRTLKTLLDATIRERLKLETLLDEVREASGRLEALLHQTDQISESRREPMRSTEVPAERVPAESGVSRNERMREVDAMLRHGATASEIAAEYQIPIGEVELMVRLLQPRL